jgi:hypothetical protein
VLNRDGCLGKAVLDRIAAGSPQEAEDRARQSLEPWLSHVAVLYDMRVQIEAIYVIDLDTADQTCTMTTPQNEVSYAQIPVLPSDKELQFYSSFYREALNTDSPAYKVLCFYKVIEGCRNHRKRLGRKTRTTPPQTLTILPYDHEGTVEWLGKAFPGRTWDRFHADNALPHRFRGMELARVDDDLKKLRDSVAHALFGNAALDLSIDRAADRRKLEEILPFMRCLAKFMLAQEFPNYFAIIPRPPSVVEIISTEAALATGPPVATYNMTAWSKLVPEKDT